MLDLQIMDSQIDQMTQTQLIFDTQFLPASADSHPPSRLPSLAPSPVHNSTRSASKKASSMDSLPPSDPIEPSFDSMSLGDHGQETVDTRMVKDLIHNAINNATEDSEMLGSYLMFLSLRDDRSNANRHGNSNYPCSIKRRGSD